MQDRRTHNIVVCCDGTWCGFDTETRTNIKILADAFASEDPTHPVWIKPGVKGAKHNNITNTDVCYFDGVGTRGAEGEDERPGLLGGFFDLLVYCTNGAVAADLPERCREAYRFIAETYQGPDVSRVWLFGLSRGAYTVRAVAGMINNAGIVKKDWAGDTPSAPDVVPAGPDQDPDEGSSLLSDMDPLGRLVQRVWDLYASDEDGRHPDGKESIQFRSDDSRVWQPGSKPPVVFMGLFDTVGATGLPRIDGLDHTAPLTYEYRPFRDLVVSSEVQNVFQACSTHDRLAPFQPCFVRRRQQKEEAGLEGAGSGGAGETGPSHQGPKYAVQFSTEEVWYPGAHYDLGRQKFVFSNQPLSHAFLGVLNLFRTNVNYTPELSDYPLLGYELDGPLGPPAKDAALSTASYLAAYPPCIVGKVCCIDSAMLPLPDNLEVWKQLVAGEPPGTALAAALGDSIAGGNSILQEVRERGVLRTVAKKTVEVASAAVNWSLANVAGTKLVAQELQAVGQHLPIPAFQPPYDIDAETKILEPLAELVGYVITGRPTPNIILRDRTIPMPIDKDGFDIGTARFFKVPADGPGSFASYTPTGRSPKPWHMSKTYLRYQQELDEWNGRRGSGQGGHVAAAGAGSASAAARASRAPGQQKLGGARGGARATSIRGIWSA